MHTPRVAPVKATGRRRAMVLLGAVCVATAGCATKKDVKLLRDEVLTLQARQDSLFRVQERNYRMLLDTLQTSFEIQQDAAGQTSHRFRELEDQLGRTESMLNQLQALVSDLINRLDRPETIAGSGGLMGGSASADTMSGEAAEAYQAAMIKLNEGAPSTARETFLFIVEQHPNHPLAPDAQYQIGMTYRMEGDPAKAIAAFEKVEALWSQSPRAPQALLQAGITAGEQNDTARARTFYQMVVTRFPNSPEAAEARRRLGGGG